MRKIKIYFFIDDNSNPIVKYEEFPSCFTAIDIYEWCHKIIDKEFYGMGSFMWVELD